MFTCGCNGVPVCPKMDAVGIRYQTLECRVGASGVAGYLLAVDWLTGWACPWRAAVTSPPSRAPSSALQGAQMMRQFAAVLVPPIARGVMWSS